MSGTIEGWVRSAAYKPDILNLDLAATSSSNSRRWTVKNKTASRVLRRLLAEIKRRTDPVTIQINQRFVSVVIRRRQRFEIQN
ncbi:hypothetical protein V1478_005568 [Vespula squamosa]|uniref:Uncharacterized protein n=1 Tax=Vespula squamosa TaxID=30214 RepID=A0ABD2BAI7_VESSQ